MASGWRLTLSGPRGSSRSVVAVVSASFGHPVLRPEGHHGVVPPLPRLGMPPARSRRPPLPSGMIDVMRRAALGGSGVRSLRRMHSVTPLGRVAGAGS